MMCLRGVNQRGTGVPERSIPMPVNFCKEGFMSTCMAHGKGWSVHEACHFSHKSSRSDRCMYCVHDGLCDNYKAQDDVRHPIIVLDELQELLDADFEGQKEEEELPFGESREVIVPEPVPEDVIKIDNFLNKAKGGP